MCTVCVRVFVCFRMGGVSVSEPPVRLWPAGCWEPGEAGWAVETSPLAACVCGGGSHPAEQVSHQPHCKRSPLWVRASLDSFSFYHALSISVSHGFLSHWFSHTLMAVIFLCCIFPCNSLLCFLFSDSSLISLPLTVSLYYFLLSLSWQNNSSRLGVDNRVWDYRLL